MTRSVFAATLLLLAGLCRAGNVPREPTSRPINPIESAEVDRLVKPLVDGQWCASVTVGVIDRRGKRVMGFGSINPAGISAPRPPDGRTIYEIGSVSKTFTCLLLADMVVEKQVSLDDPVRRYLPATVDLPPRGLANAKSITLLNLATQRSGLPRMPDNFHPKDPLNPYADYTAEQMYDFLSHCNLAHEPGEKYEYSNLGMGLLGHVLSLKAGVPYEQVLVARICMPLGMNDTRIALDADQKSRLAPGSDADLEPQPNWDIPTLAGAGAIRSTAADMLDYIAAQIGQKPVEADLAAAISLSQQVRADVEGIPDTRIALAWYVDTRQGVYWHNGQTGGYHSFVAFNPEAKVGVVLLTNTGSGVIDAAGRSLIARELGYEQEPVKLPAVVTVDAKVLDKYVGQYLMWPGLVLTITRDGEHLNARITGQPKLRIYPSSETEFFWKMAPARIGFVVDDNGNAIKAVIHQGGRDASALRVRPEKPLN